ncbi:MAG: DUF3817 domain-containing protein [Phycisphaerales bacterium JB063]
MLATPIGRLRLLGLIEGTSTLVLFFVAMPIKYIDALGANPTPVRIVGSVHGGLFLLYLAAVALVAIRPGLPGKLLAMAVGAAVIPFGPFVLDGKLKRYEAQTTGQAE